QVILGNINWLMNRTTVTVRPGVMWQESGVSRWQFRPTGDAAGDLVLSPYNDTGTPQADVIVFNRSTGLATVRADPTANLGVVTKQYSDFNNFHYTAEANLPAMDLNLLVPATYRPGEYSLGSGKAFTNLPPGLSTTGTASNRFLLMMSHAPTPQDVFQVLYDIAQDPSRIWTRYKVDGAATWSAWALTASSAAAAGNFVLKAGDTGLGNMTSLNGAYYKFSHANPTDVNDGRIGARLFARGLNIIGIGTEPGSTQRYVRVWGILEDENNVPYAKANGAPNWATGADYPVGRLVTWEGLLFRVVTAITGAPATPNFATIVPYDAPQGDYFQGAPSLTNWADGNWMQLATFPPYGNFRFQMDCFDTFVDSSVSLEVTTSFSSASVTVTSYSRNPNSAMWQQFRLSRAGTSGSDPIRLEGQIYSASTIPSFKLFIWGIARQAANGVSIPKPPQALASGANLGGTQYALATLPTATHNASGSIAIGSDGAGLWTYSGGGIYKATGTGVVIRKSTGNEQPQIEDNNGTNRRNILDDRVVTVVVQPNQVTLAVQLGLQTIYTGSPITLPRTGNSWVRIDLFGTLTQTAGGGSNWLVRWVPSTNNAETVTYHYKFGTDAIWGQAGYDLTFMIPVSGATPPFTLYATCVAGPQSVVLVGANTAGTDAASRMRIVFSDGGPR
ncbi:MAG TPA: hypothetical protein VIX37_22960, partial [Candidatus Sulfotelmatobacter sp.]